MAFADSSNADTQTSTSCYLSFPSLKNPEAQAHTAEAIIFADYDFFSQLKHNPWRKRGPEYTALKDKLSENILYLVEKHYPGFKELVQVSVS